MEFQELEELRESINTLKRNLSSVSLHSTSPFMAVFRTVLFRTLFPDSWQLYEILGFWCPLAALEQWPEVRGNILRLSRPFPSLHYLDAVMYSDIPPKFLIAGVGVVCILNLGIYARCLRVRHSLG